MLVEQKQARTGRKEPFAEKSEGLKSGGQALIKNHLVGKEPFAEMLEGVKIWGTGIN